MSDHQHQHHDHGHHHSHGVGSAGHSHASGEAVDYVAANKEYYTSAVANFDRPEWTQLAKE